MKSFAVLAFAGLQISWGQSISSCGNPGDHASNLQLSISPDPIGRGKAFSVHVGGDLDEDITAGSIALDITASILGQDLSTITEALDFKLSDGLIKKVTGLAVDVGPIKLPLLPGSAVVNGTIKIVNDKGEPVACVKLDLKAPLLDEGTKLEETKMEELAPVSGLTICSKSTDHIKNLKIDEAADTSVTITGTIDEVITGFTVNAALKVKIGPIPYTVNFPVPVKLTKFQNPVDDFSIYVSAPKGVKSTLNAIISVTGEITATDSKGEEILCLDIGDTTKAIVV